LQIKLHVYLLATLWQTTSPLGSKGIDKKFETAADDDDDLQLKLSF